VADGICIRLYDEQDYLGRPRVPCVPCVSRLPPVSFYRYQCVPAPPVCPRGTS
jgi:hypothetical protein